MPAFPIPTQESPEGLLPVYFPHMRYSLIVLGICLAAIVVGGAFYMYGPDVLRENPLKETGAGALGADLAEEVSFSVLVEGQDSQITERKNFAAYSREDFEELWTRAFGENAPALPSVNFDESYVIGVFAGQKPSGGHSIAVTRVVDENTVRTVAITLTRPGTGCLTSQALTSPYQFVVVPFSDRPLAKTDQELEACR